MNWEIKVIIMKERRNHRRMVRFLERVTGFLVALLVATRRRRFIVPLVGLGILIFPRVPVNGKERQDIFAAVAVFGSSLQQRVGVGGQCAHFTQCSVPAAVGDQSHIQSHFSFDLIAVGHCV